jgi:uncharacterized protein
MLQKLLLLLAVLAIVWYGFKYVGRLTQQRQRKIAEKEERARKGISDTVQCPVCDAYIAEDLKSDCGKADCPY